MNKQNKPFTINYIEIPLVVEPPIKISKILRHRMKAFLATRKGCA